MYEAYGIEAKHLFLALADGVGASNERFLIADPTMGSTDAPAAGEQKQYVVRAIIVSIASNATIEIHNADSAGKVFELDLAGGAGALTIPAPAGLAIGKNKYPRLTLAAGATPKTTIHLFCTLEHAPFTDG